MRQELAEIGRTMPFASPTAQAVEGGYIAMVSINVAAFTAHQKEILCKCLTGWVVAGGQLFFSPVCDNREEAIVFDTESEALEQAKIRASSLPRQFSYGAYAEFGIAVPVEQSPQIFFTPRKKLKRQ